MAGDPCPHTLFEAGLSAYVRAETTDGELRVVVCRACGTASSPLAAEHEIDWFRQHVAEDFEEHRWGHNGR